MEPTPASISERIPVVDALRGFALLGILLVNLLFFSGPADLVFGQSLSKVASPWTYLGLLTFLQGKFYGIFSFLFGLGFAVQMDRFEARGEHPGRRFRRRLLVLLGFGLLHGLLVWMGDILAMYALIGLLLPAFRRCRPRTLLIWAGCLLLGQALVFLAVSGITAMAFATAPEQMAKAMDQQAQASALKATRSLAAYGSGPYGQLFHFRARELAFNYGATLAVAPHILAMFLLGLWTWRQGLAQGLAQDLERQRPFLRKVLGWGLGLGLPGSLAYAFLFSHGLSGSGLPKAMLGFSIYFVASPALSLGYMAAFALLFMGPGRRVLALLPEMGRMSLTHYLGQSLVMTTVFYFYGLGLFGKVALPWALLMGLGLWILQVLLSRVWLVRHAQGPMESLWRRLTYGPRASGLS